MEESTLSRYARRYPEEFRRQMVELVREFEPTVNTIRNCVK